jgi:RimJ/RimL family protein N-acetyltransferase
MHMTPVYFDGSNGERLASIKPNVTISCDKRIEVCGGLSILLKGTAEGWIVVDRKPHWQSVIDARRQLDEWIRDYDLHRVQAIVREDFKAGGRFLVWMGMHLEALLEKFYSPSMSALLYARIR